MQAEGIRQIQQQEQDMNRVAIVTALFAIFAIGCEFKPGRIIPTETGKAEDVATDVSQDVNETKEGKIHLLWAQDETKTYVGSSQKPAATEDFIEPPRSDFFIVHFSCFGWENIKGVKDLVERYQDGKMLLRGFHPDEYPDTDEWGFSFDLPPSPKKFDTCYIDIFTCSNVGLVSDWQAVLFERQVSGTTPVTTEYGTLWYSSTEKPGQIFATIGIFPMIEDRRWEIPMSDLLKE